MHRLAIMSRYRNRVHLGAICLVWTILASCHSESTRPAGGAGYNNDGPPGPADVWQGEGALPITVPDVPTPWPQWGDSWLLQPMGKIMYGLAGAWGDVDRGGCVTEPDPTKMVTALSQRQFSDFVCGACIEAAGYAAVVQIKIVDICAACASYGLDLSETAWNKLTDPEIVGIEGHVHATWRFVPCNTTGPIRIHYVPGYDAGGPVYEVLNHALPIVGLDVLWNGTWQSAQHGPCHTFRLPLIGTGPDDPVTIRIIANDGSTIIETLPAYHADETWIGVNQFSQEEEPNIDPTESEAPIWYQGIPEIHSEAEAAVYRPLYKLSVPGLWPLTGPLDLPTQITAENGESWTINWRWLPYPANQALQLSGNHVTITPPAAGQPSARGYLLAWCMVGSRPVTRHFSVKILAG